jgi:hypothetical protein
MEDLSRLLAPLAALLFILIGLAFTALWIAGAWKMFEKAGQPGWGILVPIYNLLLIVRIAGSPDWMFILLLIPGVNIVAHILVSLELGKRFSRGAAFTIGLIFIPAVFYALIGFGSDQYTPPPALAPADDLPPAGPVSPA